MSVYVCVCVHPCQVQCKTVATVTSNRKIDAPSGGASADRSIAPEQYCWAFSCLKGKISERCEL
uniref:Bm746 n=1 Tax=Brugia malayi TaxID=6279 RepID=A0A0J9Y3Y8_BRUMA|nr:Bm746 [Brugia malayi]